MENCLHGKRSWRKPKSRQGICCCYLEARRKRIEEGRPSKANPASSAIFPVAALTLLSLGNPSQLQVHSCGLRSWFGFLTGKSKMQKNITKLSYHRMLEVGEHKDMAHPAPIFFFFFFPFLFQGCTCSIWKFPDEGLNQSCSYWPTPQPQPHWIEAASVIHATAHGNAGSLTH